MALRVEFHDIMGAIKCIFVKVALAARVRGLLPRQAVTCTFGTVGPNRTRQTGYATFEASCKPACLPTNKST